MIAVLCRQAACADLQAALAKSQAAQARSTATSKELHATLDTTLGAAEHVSTWHVGAKQHMGCPYKEWGCRSDQVTPEHLSNCRLVLRMSNALVQVRPASLWLLAMADYITYILVLLLLAVAGCP